MKNFFLATLSLLLAIPTFAQFPGGGAPAGGYSPQSSITGRITGTLVDSSGREPIEFATVVLMDIKTNSQKDGVITDEKGVFKLNEVRLGKYNIQLSFLGYQSRMIMGVELTPEKPDVDLGNLALAAEGFTLDAVEVTGEAGAIENKIDKLVYNADKDISTGGGDATDVLQRVPLLAVDAEGNLSLRGSSNIQILVNGKPSGIFASNPAEALRTIPADQIKSVEVITAPSARYDGEGTAGIVNIITKKKSVDGFTGTFSSSLGTRSSNGSLGLNFARGRFGLNFNGGGWYNWPRPSTSSFYREDFSGVQPRVLEQNGNGTSAFYGPRATLGAFYDINAYNSINTSFSFRGFGRTNENVTDASFIDPNFGIDQQYTRTSESESLRGGFDWNTDFRRTFKKAGQELAFAVQISGDISNQTNNILQNGNDPGLFLNTSNQNDGLNLETTLQTDYVHPFSKAVTVETGAKAILRTIESDFSYRDFNPDTKQFDTDLTRSDVFTYEQDVFAGYLSFNVKLGDKWGVIAGSRYERTYIAGDYDRSEVNFDNNYDNFLPSLILNRKLGKFSNLRLSYAKRIQRPSLRFVNPYVEIEDPRDVTVGNPEVLPENTDQYELNYNTFIKGIVLNGSVFYRQTNDVIESFLTIREDGVSVTTFQNIGKNQTYGANIFSSINVKDKLSIRGGVNFSIYDISAIIAGQELSNSVVVWNGNLSGTLTLPKQFKFEVNGFYSSPRASLQGTRASYQRISFAIQKDLWDKRGSIGIVAVQPFNRDLRFPNELSGPTFFQRSDFAVAQRSYGINFNYRFGKLDFKNRKERTTRIRNQDQKDDGGNNNF